ncbi:MAG TPA: glycoside hydrolase family 2 TIM barrel-domain containing protein, partial [Verrucomicrobiae bacterium]|nr:glycoside hydrolase family 2 TIM barrel-domain containing protein [Verrucomicrobiae bacterium]
MKVRVLICGIAYCALEPQLSLAGDAFWQPKCAPLQSRWAAEVNPNHSRPEYPRPQMVRAEWSNLNGLWDYAITEDATVPSKWDGRILVPFPVESALSGVMRELKPTERIWYRRKFAVPPTWAGMRVLMHFDAVNWEAGVLLNGRKIGTHLGGYDGFTIDITESLDPTGDDTLEVVAANPADAGMQARGKQTRSPTRTWYGIASGIWQTVWLEPVAPTSISQLYLIPDIDASELHVTAQILGRGKETNQVVEGVAFDNGKEISRASGPAGQPFDLPINRPKLWSPDSPFLYNLTLTLRDNGKQVDQVSSYFGMRKISVANDSNGIPRILLNNEPLFQFGILDQGYWPEGIYTAPTDEALRFDIEMMKKLGFNTCRKHVKVEPERWYCWCDKLGLLVWQDMPNGAVGDGRLDRSKSDESAQQFEHELKAMVEGRINHPSIVMWMAFNQGWGQYDTARLTDLIKSLDATRL